MNRNIFDQFKHHENRLTHALAVALSEDKSFLKAFISEIVNNNNANDNSKFPIRDSQKAKIIEQTVPGIPSTALKDQREETANTIPDAVIYVSDDVHPEKSWAIAIESKINAGHSKSQLDGHIRVCFKTIELI